MVQNRAIKSQVPDWHNNPLGSATIEHKLSGISLTKDCTKQSKEL